MEAKLTKLQNQVNILQEKVDFLEGKETQLEKYYQTKLEALLPGAGHRHLVTNSGSSIFTDITSPDDWNPNNHNGMPPFHIEVKRTSGYKEIITQLEMAQRALPRELLIGVLFVNPSSKKLKDIFEVLHPHGIKVAFFDHRDQLWWYDGKDIKPIEYIWKITRELQSNPFETARDVLLTKTSNSNGVSVNIYVSALLTWAENNSNEIVEKSKTRNKFYEAIDLSLTGFALDAKDRRFGVNREKGWKGWTLK